MKKIDIKNPRFGLVNSTLKDHKEVEVVFNYNGEDHKYFIFIKEGKNVNYINEAKKQFEKDVKSGKVLKTINVKPINHRPWLIAGASVLGVAAITFASLFTWKMLTNNEVMPEPGPEPGPTPSETYKFTFTGTNCSIDGSKSFTKEIEKGEENVQFTVNPDDGFQLDYYHAEGINLEGNTLTIDKMDKDYTVNLNGIDDDIAVTFRVIVVENKNISFDCEGTITEVDWGDDKPHDTENSHTYDTKGEYKVTIKGVLTSFLIDGNQESVVNLNIYSNIESIGDNAFQGYYSLISINLPDSVKSIGTDVFYDCRSLISINIPSGVTSIKSRTFQNCHSLASISLPDGVTSIESDVFYECYSLTSINLPNGLKSIGDNAFNSCRALRSLNIPNSVTEIGSNVFGSCYSLVSVNLPDGLESIGDHAFYECYSLHFINIPNSVTEIDSGAFANCSSLVSVNLPDGLESIGSAAFSECRALRSIKIPSSVTTIYNEAFNNCASLSIIDFREFIEPDADKIPTFANDPFGGDWPSTRRYYVTNDEMLETFINESDWAKSVMDLFTTDPVPSI